MTALRMPSTRSWPAPSLCSGVVIVCCPRGSAGSEHPGLIGLLTCGFSVGHCGSRNLCASIAITFRMLKTVDGPRRERAVRPVRRAGACATGACSTSPGSGSAGQTGPSAEPASPRPPTPTAPARTAAGTGCSPAAPPPPAGRSAATAPASPPVDPHRAPQGPGHRRPTRPQRDTPRPHPRSRRQHPDGSTRLQPRHHRPTRCPRRGSHVRIHRSEKLKPLVWRVKGATPRSHPHASHGSQFPLGLREQPLNNVEWHRLISEEGDRAVL